MKMVNVEIRGVTSLLQHRFGESSEAAIGKATRAITVMRGTPRDEAEAVCYRDKSGALYHPGAAIARLLREAGGGHKLKGSRKSAKFVVPAAVLVLDDAIPLFSADGSERAKDFEVDSRPVTIPATKGRIMRHRPRLDGWSAKFSIRINEELLPPEFVQQLLTEGGLRLGIGDYRPERGGSFGTFQIIKWSEQA